MNCRMESTPAHTGFIAAREVIKGVGNVPRVVNAMETRMQIIGAGFGRTGTMSLKVALEQLGFGPCYHMIEVFKRPGHIRIWQAAADGEQINWRHFLRGYQAGLDYPLAAFYKQLIDAFPDARVILTVRDPQDWYDSTRQTIYRGTALPHWLLRLLPPFTGMQAMVESAIWERLFDGRFEDRQFAIRIFEEHIEEVQRLVPAGRLLVYHVKDGWGPLCDFLGVPALEGPFPHINDRQTTQRMYLAARLVAGILAFGLVGLFIWLVSLIV